MFIHSLLAHIKLDGLNLIYDALDCLLLQAANCLGLAAVSGAAIRYMCTVHILYCLYVVNIIATVYVLILLQQIFHHMCSK